LSRATRSPGTLLCPRSGGVASVPPGGRIGESGLGAVLHRPRRRGRLPRDPRCLAWASVPRLGDREPLPGALGVKIAFVTVRVPYPENSGGRIRTFQLLKHVSEVHPVTLVTAIEGPAEARAAAELQERIPRLAIRAVEVPPRNTPTRRLRRALAGVFDPLPYTWAAYRHRRFTANLGQVLAGEAHTLLHCDHVQVAHAVLAV